MAGRARTAACWAPPEAVRKSILRDRSDFRQVGDRPAFVDTGA
jgi:hypothetical protein